MSLNFPPNPAEGQRYSSDGQTYVRRSGRWVALAYGEADELIREHQIPGRNLLINGGFDVWQRGISFSGSGYCADRWFAYKGDGSGNCVITQTTGTSIARPDSTLRFMQDVASPTERPALLQRVEGVRAMSGQPVTLSFWAHTDVPLTISPVIHQIFGTGGSDTVSVPMPEIQTVGPVWTRYETTVVLPTIDAATFGVAPHTTVRIEMPAGMTFTVFFHAVQCEIGAVATPFERRPVGVEMTLARRYFQAIRASGSYSFFGAGIIRTATDARFLVYTGIEMRAIPAISLSGAFRIFAGSVDAAPTFVGGSFNQPGIVYLNMGTTGMTAGQGATLTSNADPNAVILVDAEL